MSARNNRELGLWRAMTDGRHAEFDNADLLELLLDLHARVSALEAQVRELRALVAPCAPGDAL